MQTVHDDWESPEQLKFHFKCKDTTDFKKLFYQMHQAMSFPESFPSLTLNTLHQFITTFLWAFAYSFPHSSPPGASVPNVSPYALYRLLPAFSHTGCASQRMNSLTSLCPPSSIQNTSRTHVRLNTQTHSSSTGLVSRDVRQHTIDYIVGKATVAKEKFTCDVENGTDMQRRHARQDRVQ